MDSPTDIDIQQYAQALDRAERERIQIEALSMRYPQMSIADAYRVQESWVNAKVEAGHKVTGYKIGLTSRAMQKAMNIDTPDYGVLLDSMHFANGSTITANDFCDPRIEVELAFVLKEELYGTDLSIADVLDATDYVVAALELIAARSFRTHPKTGYTRKVVDTISDNAANAGIVLGDVHLEPHALDLRWSGAILFRNDVVEVTGLAAGVLNHPARGIVEVARMFAAYDTRFLPGQILLSGSFTSPVKVAGGDEIVAEYNDFGQVSCRFA